MDLGGGMMAPAAPSSVLRMAFERVVLESPAAVAQPESQERVLPDLLDALPAAGGAGGFGCDAAGGFSQETGLFWCGHGGAARSARGLSPKPAAAPQPAGR
jgi:hypothetical protein